MRLVPRECRRSGGVISAMLSRKTWTSYDRQIQGGTGRDAHLGRPVELDVWSGHPVLVVLQDTLSRFKDSIQWPNR